MKKLLSIFIILFAQVSFAALKVERNNQNQLILSDDSCDALIKHTKSLDQWTKNSQQIKNCPVNVQSPTEENNRCSYDITNCVPDHLNKYLGLQPKYNGPNCWNLSLVMKNILPALRYSTSEEMEFYMNSPLCRQLKNDEEKIPGDIGAIRIVTPDAVEEYHGFIYISDDLSYSKNGFAKENPYSLLPAKDVFNVYGVPDDPRCKKNEIDKSLKCGFATAYLRCMSMEEYLANQNTPKEILTAISEVDNFDKCLESSTLNNAPLSNALEKHLTDTLNVISNYLYDETEKVNASNLKDPQQIFMLASLNLKLNAIAMQLDGNNKKGYGQVVGGFYEHIHAMTEELKGKK